MSNPPPVLPSPASLLPDRLRPRLTPPARAVAWALVKHAGTRAFTAAGHLAWRARNPATRESYVEAPAPGRIPEIWYTAEDGWRAPLCRLAPRSGGAGEPVLLAHTLGAGSDGFRYGTGPTLAGALCDAGFTVFLLTHRGDRAALRPGGRCPTDFDAILERDVPAAIAAICDDTGFSAVHWVGHGLGAQLGLAAAGARAPGIATVTALAGPVQFSAPRSDARRAAWAAALLPVGWPVPVRWLARFAAPLLGDPDGLAPGPRLRGVATHASDDLAIGLVRQLSEWVGHGVWSSRGGVVDRKETLRHAEVPLLALCGDADRVCPAGAAEAATGSWGHPDRTFVLLPGYAHLDALFSARAQRDVFAPVTDWLHARRRLAWGAGFSALSAGVADRYSTR